LLGLHQIFVLFEPFVQESILLLANTPLVWAPHFPPSSPTLLRNILFLPDHTLLQHLLYNIGNDNIVYRPMYCAIVHAIKGGSGVPKQWRYLPIAALFFCTKASTQTNIL